MAGKATFVEWFCGIGGFSESVRGAAEIRVAVDINQNALGVYRANFDGETLCKSIESLTVDETSSWADASWWMSPPCQPHTVRGRQKDLEDPRSRAFENVLRLIAAHQPPEIALENVPGFAKSKSFERLHDCLGSLGYCVAHRIICPTELGIRNRRKRFYLLAAKQSLANWQSYPKLRHSKPKFSDDNRIDLFIENAITNNYCTAMDVVEADSEEPTACFTSAYGRSIVRSGSYLETNMGLRRFSPSEILDQLGFRDSYRLPDWPPSRLWPLVGNSLSIPVVRYVISHLPSFYNCDQEIAM